MALVSSYHLDPSVIAKEKLIEVGRFLEFMQMKDGNFHSKYFPDKEGRSNAWVSLYYPGEAALGAVMLYAIDPDVRWLTISAKGLSYLANKRKGQGTNVEADHWALLATKGLLYHLDEFEDPPAPREMLIEHGKQIVRKMLEDFDSVSSRSVAYGGSTRDGRTTPTATRLEGLLAAYEFLPDSEAELKAEVLRICELGIAFLIKHQIRQEGPFKGAIPRAIGPVKKGKDRKSIRQFNQRATEIRIDYVQHALSAMLQLRDIRQKARP